MSGLLRTAVDAVFVFSVIFIWFMLLYQFVLTLGGFLWRRRLARRPAPGPADDASLPEVSILVPARNEEKVIGGLIERIQAFAYPPEKLEVLVINDGSSDRTGEIVREAGRTDRRIRLLDIPASESGRGKSAALNRALRAASHDVIAVYDSDNIPERDSLRLLCRALAANDRLAAVTGKFRAYNRRRNLLTSLVNIESIAFQWIIQAGRWFFLKIAFLPGTNFVIRRSVLDEVGGWDEAALTEDSELTFRIYQKGWLVEFLPDAVTWEQEPERLRTWVRQRTRWARGNAYVIAKHGRRLFKTRPSLTTLELLNLFYLYYLFIFAILFSDLLFVLSLFHLVRLRIVGPYAALWGLAFLLFILEILIALSYEKEDSWRAVGLALLAYLTYTKLWVFVVVRGFYEETLKKKARVWAKTERFDFEKENVPSEE